MDGDGPFFMNILKATEPLRGGTLLFTTKLPSILSFPKKLLPTIFQFVRSIDLNFYAWYDLVQWQPSTKGDNRWRHLAQEKKMCDLQIRYHF